MAEGQILQNPVSVRGVHLFGGAHVAPAFWAFGLEQVPFARAHAHHLAGAGDFESFGHRLLRFNAFGSSHKSVFSKRTVNIGCHAPQRKSYFGAQVLAGWQPSSQRIAPMQISFLIREIREIRGSFPLFASKVRGMIVKGMEKAFSGLFRQPFL
jgi:hypothetical protein